MARRAAPSSICRGIPTPGVPGLARSCEEFSGQPPVTITPSRNPLGLALASSAHLSAMPDMPILTVNHRTVYSYARPVEFGAHRLMFRPRDSHDLRLVETGLLIRPAASVRWLHDVFGNSIAMATFDTLADELVFESTFRAETFPVAERAITLEPFAQRYPFSYSADEIPDLSRAIERSYPDPEHKVDVWARTFVASEHSLDTLEIL